MTPITVAEGQIVHLHIVNNTEEYHPMHLHGHVLSVLARNGVAIEGSPVHIDSVLVGPHETWDLAFAANNPSIVANNSSARTGFDRYASIPAAKQISRSPLIA